MAETTIPLARTALGASLDVPYEARGVVVFAHGSGSSRLSPRNRMVAEQLRSNGLLGTLLFDLLTAEEDVVYTNRFEVGLLTDRLLGAIQWLAEQPEAKGLQVGCFGASTGAAAALSAAARRPEVVRAVVSRGGRPDLAGPSLRLVQAPTLLIVGGNDPIVIDMNQQALDELGAEVKHLEIVPGATHLFDEAGTLERVAELSLEWFERYLGGGASNAPEN